MNIETQVFLNRFHPRFYQLPILDAIENKGYKRVLAILPRRAGKDYACWQLCIRECIRKTRVIYYIFPTFSQGRRVIWDSITNTGERFLDFIPQELIESINSQQMAIRFKNNSLLQIVGSDNFDALMGTNPQGVVFSEYALQDPRAYQYIRPILTANDGWAVFISTPRGKNHLYELFQIATKNPEWFAYRLTVDDTKHISLHDIERERASGEMDEALIQQEYYCSFEYGVTGSYYSKYIEKARLEGRIGVIPYEPTYRVNTSWDLGIVDPTAVIFWQVCGQIVRIIDYYEISGASIEHLANVIKSKPYVYGQHFGPHDLMATEMGTGLTRFEMFRRLDIKFEQPCMVEVLDGIEAVRAAFHKFWIDEQNCASLIKALENYREEFDAKRKVYKGKPLHNWSSHGADAMRYLCAALPKTRDGLSAQDLNKNYYEALYGNNTDLPGFFKGDFPRYY